jgi:predicted Rossmann-fold nucleotide-binding protein
VSENKTNIVTVFGTSKAADGEAVFEMAKTLGQLLAENGFKIANGGYGGTERSS